MKLKSIPEDFIVVEIASHHLTENGQYFLVEMTKRNYTTERAVATIADAIGVPRKMIGYAGTKDARAVTRQYLSIRSSSPEVEDRIKRFSRDGLAVRLLGKISEPLSLGMLDGNRFEIVARNLSDQEYLHPISTIPNLFDEQRFSTANTSIGKSILLGDFQKAVSLIQMTDDEVSYKMNQFLESRPNDFVGALRLVTKNLLLLYVHAYQSALWNEVLSRYILSQDSDAILIEGPIPITVPSRDLSQIKIPLVGFASDLVEPFSSWYAELLARDGLSQRDFIVRPIPFLTVEGTQRDAFIFVEDLTADDRIPDPLHPGASLQRLCFRLPKGAYATIVTKCLCGSSSIEGS